MSNGKRFGFVSLAVVAGGAALLAWLVTSSILKPPPGVLPGGSGSPVKVHGGAMAFRVTKDYTWYPNASAAAYCLGYNPQSITIDDGGGTSGSITSTTLSGSWMVVFRGALPSSPLSPSGNGIQMKPSNTPCHGGTGPSIQVTPWTANSAFYPTIVTENDRASAIRFQDTTPNVCFGPNSGMGDEDQCERLGGIDVTVSGKKTTTTCVNRECNATF